MTGTWQPLVAVTVWIVSTGHYIGFTKQMAALHPANADAAATGSEAARDRGPGELMELGEEGRDGRAKQR
ncbi:MAG: hypothetical protein ACR2MC_09285 [Actinomycetota bacterium]